MQLPPLPIDDYVSLYASGMSWLHSGTSRPVQIEFPPQKSGCPNHLGYDFINKRAMPIYNTGNVFSQTDPTVIPSLMISGVLNVPFASGTTCPVCNGEGNLYSPASGAVNARILWQSQVALNKIADVRLAFNGADVRLKVLQQDKDLLERATKVIVDGYPCTLVKAGIPVGFRDVHSYYYYYNITK